MKKILLAIGFLFLCFCRISFALNVDTHNALNQNIASKNINEFSLNTYLVDRLGFKNGKDEDIKYYFKKQPVFKWLGEGGEREDDPFGVILSKAPVRAANHFHDPVNDAGWGWGMSAIDWAFLGRNQQYWGNYSWADVRNYFITALTYKDTSMRDVYFAETFRGLGQLMHLVEDMSVPEHTRNQFHNPSDYEEYISSHTIYNNSNSNIDVAAVLTFSETSARLPIANLFDTGQYEGYNPDVTMFNTIGLSEYTNANFLSPGTMFAKYKYNYPSEITSVTLDNHTIPDPRDPLASETVTRQYYLKTHDGDNTEYKLACVSFTTHYTTTNIYDHSRDPQKAISLDDNVYDDYAKQLMPRAVGYASGILYYFFRGTLEISAPDRYLYSIADGSLDPQQFTYIKAKVRNSTDYNGYYNGGGDAPMGTGKLWAIAKYKMRTNYDPDLAKDPPIAAEREENFSYSISEPKDGINMGLDWQEFEFNFSGDPIPAGITDLYLQVVYQGTLGNEIGTAVAVGMKDLSEPTHFVAMNATDRVYVNYILRTTQEIIDNATARSFYFDNCSDPEDYHDCTPCMYPFDVKIRIAFGRVPGGQDADYDVVVNSQPAGSYSRIIFLTDEASFTATITRDATDSFPCMYPDLSQLPLTTYSNPMPSAVNQEDSSGVFHNTPLNPIYGDFRQIYNHGLTAFLVATPLDISLYGLETMDWPQLNGSTPIPITINR